MNPFDQIFDRVHSDSVKYEGLGEDSIALSLADMDFPTAPCIVNALKERMEFPLFGYVKDDPKFQNTIAAFYHLRFGLGLVPGDILFSTGVIATLTACIRAFGQKGVGLMTPAYNGFLSTVLHSGVPVKKIPFDFDGRNYSYPWDKLEEAFGSISLFILCNPHNPLGRNHSQEELKRLIALAKKHHVVLFSDEIHGPISPSSTTYLPLFSIPGAKEVAVMASSPSKSFNLAGIQTSFAYVERPDWKRLLQDTLYADDCGEPSSFALVSSIAAYEEGGPYLDALNEYLQENKRLVEAFVSRHKEFSLDSQEATYLLWIGCEEAEKAVELFQSKGVYLSSGSLYEDPTHFRMNIALPRSRLLEALRRMEEAWDNRE